MAEFGDDFAPLDTCDVPFGIVWLSPLLGLYAVVDLIDLEWSRSWHWTAAPSKSGARRVEKWYARRTSHIYTGPEGERSASKRTFNIWLHKEILLRSVGAPPSKSATIGDHINGNSLDCRRANLRWATSSENRLNLFGSASHQLKLGFKQVEKRHKVSPAQSALFGQN